MIRNIMLSTMKYRKSDFFNYGKGAIISKEISIMNFQIFHYAKSSQGISNYIKLCARKYEIIRLLKWSETGFGIGK